jgi:Amidohydrolase
VAEHTHFHDDQSVRIDFRKLSTVGFNKKRKTSGMFKGKMMHVSANGAPALTDGHFHPSNYVQRGRLPRDLLGMMDSLGIRNCVLMPIPTSLQSGPNRPTVIEPQSLHAEVMKSKPGGFGTNPKQRGDLGKGSNAGQSDGRQGGGGGCCANHHCGPLPTYYVPKEIEEEAAGPGEKLTVQHFKDNPGLIGKITEKNILYIDTAVNHDLAVDLKGAKFSTAESSRFDPMLTGFSLSDDRAGEKLLRALYGDPGVFTGIGEITVHKELVENLYADQRGQATTQREGGLSGLMNLMEMAGVVGAPVVLHCDIDNLADQLEHGMGRDRVPTNFEGLQALFKDDRLKDTTVVWAHGGGLGRFVQEGEGHLERLGELLKDCPKLHLDISWAAVARQITNDSVRQTAWTKFLEKNSERICFGSDALAPPSLAVWEETKVAYKEVLDALSPTARDNVLNSTYERVFVDARQKVRDFESKVLTSDFNAQHLRSIDGDQQPISADTVRQIKKAVSPE